MQKFKFLFPLIFLVTLIWILNQNQPFGSSLPPLGKLLNPFSGFWQNGESDSDLKSLDLNSEHLSAPVEVLFDQRLVPHIFAQNSADAAYAQGYIHAKHRLWQMDIATRSISGRLSEVLGERTLSRDRLQRKKGMVYGAENSLEAWMSSSEERTLLEAYSKGVNDFVGQLSPKDYPIEFKILDYAPELWSPMKSALFMKNMAESLCSRHTDVQATNTKAFLGPELFDFLYPETNNKQSPIIPTDVEFDFEAVVPFPAPEEGALIGMTFPHELLEQPHPNNGSNNWAIGPEKSASGNPILCSDPHLGLTLPSIWYEVHINTPNINAYGVSLPSEPGILIGFNDHIAWAETNVGHDVLDWYQIKWVDESKSQYYFDGGVKDVDIRLDTIYVKGKKPEVEATKYTIWGPVVYEDSTALYYDLAMHWVALEKPEEKDFYELGTFWKLKAAKNHQEYLDALSGYDSPAQNFAFASTDGDVAITVNGNLPVKRDQQGRFVQDGSRSENGWNGFIPRDQIPQVLNPDRGFISSANQHSTDDDYPYYYNAGFDDYRGRMVNARLDTMEQVTIEDMMKMQNSSFGLYAKEALAIILPMLDRKDLNSAEQAALSALEKWDYYYRNEDLAPVLLDVIDDSIYQFTFDELVEYNEKARILRPESWRLLELLEQYPEHPIFDHQGTKVQETGRDIVNWAFRQGVASIPEGMNWKNHNRPSVNHMASIPAFSRTGLDINGQGNTINAISGDHGPSWRMIVELGQPVKAYGVYPGGQSGNPGSRFFDQMVDQWAKGDYNELVFPKNKSGMTSDQILFSMKFKNQ